MACAASRAHTTEVGQSLPPVASAASSASGLASGGPSTASSNGVNNDASKPPLSNAQTKTNEPDIDAIAWETGGDVGNGAARKDTQNPRGENVFIAYSGWRISLPATQTWVTALYRDALRDRGVRYIWAVRGPIEPNYKGIEIGNSKIATALVNHVSDATKFILVVAHSSGSFVAHELFLALTQGFDPKGVTAGRIVYFDLDGDGSGLSPSTVARLRRGYFVGALDPTTGTASPNASDMRDAALTFGAPTSYFEHDASASGCPKGDVWCIHVSCISQKPHPKAPDPNIDYTDFAERGVNHDYLEAKAIEAGLVP